MRRLVQFFWSLFATGCAVLYLAKLAIVAVQSPSLIVFLQIGTIFFLLYLLFMLEGLQVAGLQIKDKSLDAIKRNIAAIDNPAKRKTLLEICLIFINCNFDSFVTGRQILVIVTVVSMATLLSSLSILNNFEIFDKLSAPALSQFLTLLLNSALFAFISSTLLPSWISQLLPQFTADNRSLTFIKIPGAKRVLRFSILIDELEVGYPARGILNFLEKSGIVPNRELIPIGRDTFHRNAIGFYGRGKDSHKVTIFLGKTTHYLESFTFVFEQGETHEIFHKINLRNRIKGNFDVSVNTPQGVQAGTPRIEEIQHRRNFTYVVRIPLNKPLPQQDGVRESVTVTIAFETAENSRHHSEKRWVEFATNLPLALGQIEIQAASGQIVANPVVTVFDAFHDDDIPLANIETLNNWRIYQPTDTTIVTEFIYPLIGFSYRLSYANRPITPDMPTAEQLSTDYSATIQLLDIPAQHFMVAVTPALGHELTGQTGNPQESSSSKNGFVVLG